MYDNIGGGGSVVRVHAWVGGVGVAVGSDVVGSLLLTHKAWDVHGVWCIVVRRCECVCVY